MKCAKWPVIALLLGLCFALPGNAEEVKVEPHTVEVAKWEGWGCSLSWWGVYSEAWPEARRREVCRLLFSSAPDALGLNICRYNAGATAPATDPRLFRPGGKVQVTLDPDGSWHPDRDRSQIACLRLAREYGANLFELFANSPPYWMLQNGNTRGGDQGKDNLKPDAHDAFAAWLVQIARRFKKEYDISFQTIEPFNEPSAGWWKAETSNQEGCYISREDQRRILFALLAALKPSDSYKIACSDENGAEQAYNTLSWLTFGPDVKGDLPSGAIEGADIYRLNVHAYNGWDWQDRLRELAKARNIKNIWMSEVSNRESENAGFVPNDMRCALPNTRSLVSDIQRLHCSAWIYWQPVEPLSYCLQYHYTYGLLPAAVDSSVEWNGRTVRPGEFVTTKTFYALKQFTGFIRPGFRLVRSGEFWTLAALSPDSHKLVLVVHNDEKKSKNYTFDLSGFKSVGASAQKWQTRNDEAGETYNCRPLADCLINGRQFTDTLPARSVTTYVVQGMH